MMHRAEEKGSILWLGSSDPGLASVLIGDPYRLNQVLLNLLSNGIKFTSRGNVELSCSVAVDEPFSQKLAIEVTDTGMGMDESFVQHLFDKFTQEYDSVTRKIGGTGLGMSICKELIELMGGEIFVASRKGIGTTILLLLQLEKGSESDLAKGDDRPVDTESLKGKRVLVVDDNDMNRLVATTMLGNYSTVIFEAADGQEAVDFPVERDRGYCPVGYPDAGDERIGSGRSDPAGDQRDGPDRCAYGECDWGESENVLWRG